MNQDKTSFICCPWINSTSLMLLMRLWQESVMSTEVFNSRCSFCLSEWFNPSLLHKQSSNGGVRRKVHLTYCIMINIWSVLHYLIIWVEIFMSFLIYFHRMWIIYICSLLLLNVDEMNGWMESCCLLSVLHKQNYVIFNILALLSGLYMSRYKQ